MDPNIDLGTLSDEAAQVVVKGLIGTAAAALRRRLIKLFTRGDPAEEQRSPYVRRLDDTDKQLSATSGKSFDELSLELHASWKRRLMVFLEDHPEAAEELLALVNEFQDEPRHPSTNATAMSANAGDNSIVIMSGKNTRIHGGIER